MLVFLKLGGSLITDKSRPYTALPNRINSIAGQIASALRQDPALRLVLGHGSGSFGHTVASQHDTARGVTDPAGWKGFTDVWYQASRFNRMVVDALHAANLPAITISPVSVVTASDGRLLRWDTSPVRSALANDLLPVIHGDVVFDAIRGGTILSTEALFAHLAGDLTPQRILLAGREPGVWKQFPQRKDLLPEITPATNPQSAGLAEGTDVTGGMGSKITSMLALVESMPDMNIWIFSGEIPDSILNALLGNPSGTRLHR